MSTADPFTTHGFADDPTTTTEEIRHPSPEATTTTTLATMPALSVPDKFLILQLHWGDLSYFDHSQAINRAYCEKHGYTYEAVELPADDGPLPFRRLYARAPEVYQRLTTDTAVLYLDADAYVVDWDRPLSDIMDGYFQSVETAILMPENGFDSKRKWPGSEVNTGVFLVRSHPATKPILEGWWVAYDAAKEALDQLDTGDEEVSTLLTDQQIYLALNDQEVFNKRVLPHFRSNVNIARNPEFGGIDGVFIRHQLLIPNDEREQRIAKDRQRLGL